MVESIINEEEDRRQEEPSADGATPPKPFLVIGTIPIYFQEDWTAGIGGGLWSTGLAMAQYLQDFGANHVMTNLQRLYEQNQNQPLALLELGSGHGLLAICWLALLKSHHKQHWVKHLVITDTQEHLPLIQRTLEANTHVISNINDCSTKITVMDHQWGAFQSPPDEDDTSNIHIETLIRQGSYQFDVIFGSDLAYRADLYQPLLKSLDVFSKPKHYHQQQQHSSTTVILIGCTMNDTSPAFFDQARAAGFRYERLSGHLLRPEFRNQFGIFCFQTME